MGINNMPLTMSVCLILTIIIECLIALILGIRSKKDIINVVLVNIVTNPIVVTVPYLVYILFNYDYYKYSIYILEVLAFLTEGLIYLKVLDYKKINPIILSAILNISSYGIGLLLDGVW